MVPIDTKRNSYQNNDKSNRKSFEFKQLNYALSFFGISPKKKSLPMKTI